MTSNFPSVSQPDEVASPEPSDGNTADNVRAQATGVKNHAVDAAQGVAQTAKEDAADVVDEVKNQAQNLLSQTRAELRDQAGQQQQRVAAGLRAMSDEFSQMVRSSEADGMASELVDNAAQRAGRIADWLDDRDPGSLLPEVRRYASRKPGTFIAAAAIAGVLAGRITRSAASSASDKSNTPSGAHIDAPNSGVSETAGTPLYSSLGGDGRVPDGDISGTSTVNEFGGTRVPETVQPFDESFGSAQPSLGEER